MKFVTRNPRAGRQHRPARAPFLAFCLAGAIILSVAPATAQPQHGPGAVEAALRSADKSRQIRGFYASRHYRPLWIRGGTIGPEGDRLLALLETAGADGLDPDDYRPRSLAEAIEAARASGSLPALAKAEMLLSRRFADYVRDVRRQQPAQIYYVDQELKPKVPNARAVLEAAAAAPSLMRHLDTIGWMHPIYGELREALAASGAGLPRKRRVMVPPGPVLGLGAAGERVRLLRLRLGMDEEGPYDRAVEARVRQFQGALGLPQDGRAGPKTLGALNGGSPEQERILRLNLDRARALPTDGGRYVLVDAAAARLYLYENGQIRDTMRVVVGKSNEQTPMMAGFIRFAMVNPYWNIPPDLVRIRVAPGVLEQGESFLRAKGYEVLSDWSDNARPIDPALVDWHSVADGRMELRVRQLPGRDNAMGRMKFMFPNALGIYLHDTPEKELLRERDRRFSSGCVRVEDAPRLAKWLFGKPLTVRSGGPERRADLPRPVPVHITYLTAAPEGERIVFRRDVYHRDGLRVADTGRQSLAAR